MFQKQPKFGSRIAQVLADSTTSNVKIMPLVTVTKEGYCSVSSLVRAMLYGIQNSDVICYELINNKYEILNVIFEQAFKANVPVCSVSMTGRDNYPAIDGTTIATSSLDRDLNLAEYSSQGDYIDFAAPSTDVEEIFKTNSTVSRWSGPEYSNAQIASCIALIKTYNKDATILDVYNFLRNFCIDLGDENKDDLYGYGCPNFKDLKITDIDKTAPEFLEINFDNNDWQIQKELKVVAKDNIRIKSWAITQNQEKPNDEEWVIIDQVTPDLSVSQYINANGVYYIWLQDIAGNMTHEEIQVDKVDNTPPQIQYTIDETTLASGYVTVNVTATDEQSGINDSPFSWDQRDWSMSNNMRQFRENGKYKVYASDNLGNIGELEITINYFNQEGTSTLGEGDIITSVYVPSDWNEDINNSVQITLNREKDITGWQLTISPYAPSNFVEVEPENNGGTSSENPPQENNNNQPENNNNNDSQVDENLLNFSIPENVVVNFSKRTQPMKVSARSQSYRLAAARTNPIIITTPLRAELTYYLWVRDSSGSVSYQTLSIKKANV